MSEFIIKIQAPELANAIMALANAFGGQTVKVPNIAKIAIEEKAVKKNEKAATVEKAEEVVAVEEVKETKKKEVKVTDVEVRAKFVELAKKGKREELKAMLDGFEVAKVSDLKPEQYPDVMAKLGEM